MQELSMTVNLGDRVIGVQDGLAYEDFPPVHKALTQPNGLLAIGGHYSVRRLFSGFKQGVFPWTDSNSPNLWWSPDPRCVFDVSCWKASRSLRRVFKRYMQGESRWKVTFNQAPELVLVNCADHKETWLSTELQQTLVKLNEQHDCLLSVEVWSNGQLIGGLYGIALYPVIFAESMFSKVSGASKVAFMALMDYANMYNFSIVDGQVESEHLRLLGSMLIPRAEFIQYVNQIKE